MNSYSNALSIDVIQDSTGGFKSLNVKFYLKHFHLYFMQNPLLFDVKTCLKDPI